MPIQNALIVSDDSESCNFVALTLRAERVCTTIATSAREGLAKIKTSPVEVLFVDLDLQNSNGLTFIKDARRLDPRLPTVVTTSQASLELSLDALRLGVTDFVMKPLGRDQLASALVRAGSAADGWALGRRMPVKSSAASQAKQLVAVSEAMQHVLAWVRRVGLVEVPILVWGETGAGKEVLARAAHACSSRAAGPFVKFECGAIQHDQMEAILFGSQSNEGGAAAGLLERASGGVLYLDKVTELPKWMQLKLMQVIQTGVFFPREGDRPAPLNARIAASLCDDPGSNIARSKLIDELYYYLSVAPIHIPALRDHRADIRHLVNEFVSETVVSASAIGHAARSPSFSGQAMQRLIEYHWPGNVCELANLVRRAVLFADGTEIDLAQLNELLPEAEQPDSPHGTITVPYASNLRLIEREIVKEVVNRYEGNKSAAARSLGLHRRTLYRILESTIGGGLPCT